MRIWIDTETGTWGRASALRILELTDEDVNGLDDLSDTARGVAGGVLGEKLPTPEQETAIVITPPDGNFSQVLVRLPGHLTEDKVLVDFRPAPAGVWTPSAFFDKSVVIRHQ